MKPNNNIAYNSEGELLRERYQRLSEIVTEQIENWIMDGTLKAGERLNADEMAVKLGVSRMPVREAIKSLERSGLVQSIPYQGTKVTILTINDLRELYILRQDLESLAADYAAVRITDEEILQLEEIQYLLERTIELKGDAINKKIFQLNRDFHMKLYEASRMPRLCSFINMLWNSIAYYRLVVASSENYGQKMKKEHRSYIQALKCRDGKAISRLINQSLEEHFQSIPEEMDRYSQMIESDCDDSDPK